MGRNLKRGRIATEFLNPVPSFPFAGRRFIYHKGHEEHEGF